MIKKREVKKRITTTVIVLALIAVVIWSLIPRPLPIEMGTVAISNFEQRVVEDGQTRIKEKYVVSSPVDGTLLRLNWSPGDKVIKGQKLATIKWDYDRAIHAPASGDILRIVTKDEGFIYKGKPILEIGDPTSLEVVVDVLTANAILLKVGNQVSIANWGGDKPLEGRVIRIEPSAFTKVSALGVNEQRVNVVVEITSPRREWINLGDHFQVECRILVKKIENALTVPTGALFQKGGKWFTFVVWDGMTRLKEIELSEQGPLISVVKSGLKAGDRVVLYPGDRIVEGIAVKPLPGTT